jgi:hypothetical protein
VAIEMVGEAQRRKLDLIHELCGILLSSPPGSGITLVDSTPLSLREHDMSAESSVFWA